MNLIKKPLLSLCKAALFVSLFASSAVSAFENKSSDNQAQLTHNTKQNMALTITLFADNQTTPSILTYSAPTRLDRVVYDSWLQFNKHRPNKTPYWLGSDIVELRSPKNKTYTLSLLNTLALDLDNPMPLRQSAKHLSAWLDQNVTHRRLWQNLDYDFIRLNIAHNPQLQGEYQLILPTTPKDVLVVGAIDTPTMVQWQPRISAAELLTQVNVIDEHNRSQISVIQPDGQVESHSIAYWNQNHKDIAPGATLYVHYEQTLNLHRDLNQFVIQLLQNRTL
ncbi:capsule biosynthesis GfcC family protein [Photobacterium damselae]|uniref:capsule biosynthesis GfcC family protein n=1 Tax=Photobacterium damselae TaxID=38293 RepID=UPI00370A59B4